MRAPFRGRFDANRDDFVVRKQLTIAGRTFTPPEPFDKSLVNTRRLRQLFDHRSIIYAGDTPGAILPPAAAQEPELEEEVGPTEEELALAERAAVEIPEGWETLPWPKRLSLASKVSEAKIHNSDEANAAIQAELDRRAGDS